ncbi:MAG: RNA chaperone ProQ [Psychromonas sp.]|nr:RNA chaperone ProQ [Psychromonas sp.]
MENAKKFTTNKQIIDFLSEQYPLCFTQRSVAAKPLKIGIFQDLARRLENNDDVSKSQLRGGVRQYTMSWRYLHCIKENAKRVDLDGVECDEVLKKHVDHAAKTLKESKEKVFANKKKAQKSKADLATKNIKIPQRVKKTPVNTKELENLSNYKVATHEKLIVQQKVKLLLGHSPVPAVVVEILKEDVQVQLNSGITVKVKAKHLFVE